MSNKSNQRRRRKGRAGLIFVSPVVVLSLVFFFYPLAASFWQSLFNSRGGTDSFVGISQYQRLWHDPIALKSILNSGFILAFQVPLMIVLALGSAYLLNQNWLKFRKRMRILNFLPAVTTLVAYSVVFRVLLAKDGGAVNQFMWLFHVQPIDWLANEAWARVSLIAAITWRWTGYNMIILMAGLQAIPSDLYEAAKVDGANAWQTFTKIVIPQLRPSLVFVLITSTIGGLQIFDESVILTNGGPNNATMTPVLYLYKEGFRNFDFGYASAIAWTLVIFTGLISLIQFKLVGDQDD